MKRMAMLMALVLTLVPSITTKADGCDLPPNPWGEPFLIESTAYCDRGTTASGCEVRDGIVAGKREWLGKVVIIYDINENGDLDFRGFYECLDTGGDRRLKSGECIDIWMPDYDECINYGRRKIYVQIVDGKG